MQTDALVVEQLSRKYAIYDTPADRLKELILRRRFHREFWALRDVSFHVPRGGTLGIIGKNGSGKSTLLQVLAGVLRPTSGGVRVNGRVAALLELGAGFNPEFTGRENVFLNGAILGISAAEMRARFGAIADFAAIGDFIDQPVKTYSSGMYVRLAFATAINVDPDILIVDEALAVGDAQFQHRCMLRMGELQARGVTIVLVTHDHTAVTQLCERALWIDHGRVVDDDVPERVVGRYLHSLFGQAERSTDSEPLSVAAVADDPLPPPNVDRRFGNEDADIVGTGLFDDDGWPITSIVHGRPFELRVRAHFRRPVSRPIVGFMLRDRLGSDLTGTNTALEGMALPPAEAGEHFTVRFRCRPPRLQRGSYAFAVAVADGDLEHYTMNDWIDNAVTLEVIGDAQMYGWMRFPVTCAYERHATVAPRETVSR